MSEKPRTFACRYYHNGKWWALDLIAQDEDDAKSRACKLGHLQVLGEIKFQIPAAIPGVGLAGRLIVGLVNAFRSRA